MVELARVIHELLDQLPAQVAQRSWPSPFTPSGQPTIRRAEPSVELREGRRPDSRKAIKVASVVGANAEVPSWLLLIGPLLTTLFGGGLALLGSWLTVRHQLLGEHRARVEMRLDHRRNRRDAYLEDLATAMDAMNELRARQAHARLAGENRSVEDMTNMIRTGFTIRGLLGRIGDDDLTDQADAWMDALQTWAEHASPEDHAGAREVRATFDLVNRRVGHLLREPY